MDKLSDRRCESYAEYRRGLHEVLGLARQTVAIYDPDLRECGLEHRERIALLESFCRDATREDALRILVCTPVHLERDCPRLVALLTRFRHCASVRVAGSAGCEDMPPIAIVDGAHLVTRFHPEQPRGRICVDDPRAAAGPLTQFETLWIGGECRTIGASLGV